MYQINRFFKKCATSVFVMMLGLFSTSYGSEMSWPFMFDGGRLIVKSTPVELLEAKEILERVDEKHIPKSMLGGVLYDGEVIRRLPDDKFGQAVWLMKPAHFILGREKVLTDEITVISPKIEDGGVILKDRIKYRIFTVNLEGKFYIWKAVVVAINGGTY